MKEIIEGYVNLLTNENNELSEKRIIICKACELYRDGICNPKRRTRHVETNKLITGCGCVLSAKTRVPTSKCPAGKW